MPKSQRNTSERLLHEGLRLLSQQGLHGVTLGRLAEHVGMSKSGVFAHFRSIEDVQIALLDHTAQCVAPLVVEPALRAPEGLPRIDALMRAWFGWTARAGLPGGCPVAAAMFELDDVEGPVRDKVLELELGWRALLQQQVEAAVRLGHLHSELDVEQFIFELCGIYLIHHVSLRFVREPSSDARAHRALEGLIARSRPPNS
jgi:AcrR family transcriptional regulator